MKPKLLLLINKACVCPGPLFKIFGATLAASLTMSLSLTASQISKPRSARLTTARLCSRRVLMLNWPSCGPDMSPAGMLWNKNIQQMRPWSVKQLKSYIKPEVLKEELLQHVPWTNFLSCVACTKIIVRIYCFKKNNDICSSRLFFILKNHNLNDSRIIAFSSDFAKCWPMASVQPGEAAGLCVSCRLLQRIINQSKQRLGWSSGCSAGPALFSTVLVSAV